jgi:hypothetical protein
MSILKMSAFPSFLAIQFAFVKGIVPVLPDGHQPARNLAGMDANRVCALGN